MDEAELGLTGQGVVIAALVSDFGELRPDKTSMISSLFYLFFNLGAILGVGAPTILVITPEAHGFWWFLVSVTLVSVVAVFSIPEDLYNVANPDPEVKAAALKSIRMKSVRSSKRNLGQQSNRLSGASAGGEGGRGSSASAAAGLQGDGGSSALANRPSAASIRPPESARPPAISIGSSSIGGASAGGRGILYAWTLGREYRPFRLVVFARTLFYFSAGIFQDDGLFYVNSYIAPPPQGELVLGLTLVATLVIAVVFAVPAGWAAGKFGPVPSVVVSSIALGALFASLPYVPAESILFGLSPLLGFGLLLFAVADLSLIIDTLPDPTQRARDIGVWNAFQYVGNALGAAFAGPAVTSFGHQPIEFAPFYNASNPDSLPYARAGYQLIFWTGAGAILVSCIFVYLARLAILLRNANRLLNESDASVRQKASECASDRAL